MATLCQQWCPSKITISLKGAIHERDYNDWAGFHGVNEAGGEVTRKRLRGGQMLTFFASLPPWLAWKPVHRRITGRAS
jgi:hypothetical protein